MSQMSEMVALSAETWCNKQWEVIGTSPFTLKQDVVSLTDMGLFKLSISSWVIQGNRIFIQVVKFIGVRLFMVPPYYPFNFSRICSDNLSLFPDIGVGNLYTLSIFSD